uniref:EamA domain-containing protein n=1 Tax=Chlamydomonas euryale TaxID=1486919 RepID=A0A7R9YXH1_9CHLO|mmetsp:Transcript_34150/g.101518  ORF Transcript_34150/g.101518 Transcript_34150/m.101518 type:complete len:501 (+) Transcript_34150:246-1748(+)
MALGGDGCGGSGMLWASGEACVALAAFLFSVSSLAVKLTSDGLGVLQICTMSSGGCAIALYLISRSAGAPLLPQSPGMRWLVVGRATAGALTILLYYSAVEMSNLKDATALFFTAPLFCLLLESGVKRHMPGRRSLFGATATVAGALLVSNACFCALFPGSEYCGGGAVEAEADPALHASSSGGGIRSTTHMLESPVYRLSFGDGGGGSLSGALRDLAFHSLGESGGGNDDGSSMADAGAVVGLCLAVASAVTNSLAFLCVGQLRGCVPATSLTFWHHLVTVVAACIAQVVLIAGDALEMLPAGTGSAAALWSPTAADLALVCVVLAGQLGAQLLLNRGFTLASATRGAAINVMQVVFSFLWDATIFHNPIEPPSALGGTLIVSGVVVITSAPMQRMVSERISDLSRNLSVHLRGDSPGGSMRGSGVWSRRGGSPCVLASPAGDSPRESTHGAPPWAGDLRMTVEPGVPASGAGPELREPLLLRGGSGGQERDLERPGAP